MKKLLGYSAVLMVLLALVAAPVAAEYMPEADLNFDEAEAEEFGAE